MTIPVETSRSTYTGNGVATVFGTGFYFLTSNQLRVTLDVTPGVTVPTVLVEGVDYTVSMPPSVGANGSITMLVAPVSGAALVVERDVPFTQAVSYRTQGSFVPAVWEDGLDTVVMQIQELARDVDDLQALSAPSAGVAGDGLYVSGPTWNVGAGVGIQVNADDVEVIYGPAATNVYASPGATYDGVADTASRSDHGHSVNTAPPQNLAVGAVIDEGAATGLARADHQHGVPAGVPVNVTKAANAEGVAPTFARSDHKHDITTATPTELADSANSEGVAASLARSDHRHSHGNRTGGALHADATTTVAGFMSATDKVALNELSSPRSHVSVFRSTAQSIPDDTDTRVVFSSAVYDELAEYDTVGGEFAAVEAGYYLVCFTLVLNGTAAEITGTNRFKVSVYGAGVPREIRGPWLVGEYADPMVASGSVVHKLAVGEKIYLEAYHFNSDTGVSRSLGSGGVCWMTIDRIA